MPRTACSCASFFTGLHFKHISWEGSVAPGPACGFPEFGLFMTHCECPEPLGLMGFCSKYLPLPWAPSPDLPISRKLFLSHPPSFRGWSQ